MSYCYVAVVVINSWKCVLEHVYIGELGEFRQSLFPHRTEFGVANIHD
jgi:hypothetical protein